MSEEVQYQTAFIEQIKLFVFNEFFSDHAEHADLLGDKQCNLSLMKSKEITQP